MANQGHHVLDFPQVTPGEYAQRRRQAYPGISPLARHPTKVVERDYHGYKELQFGSNKAYAEYEIQRDQYRAQSNPLLAADTSALDSTHTPDAYSLRMLQHDLRGIEPRYHGQLVDPCTDAEYRARRHGDARAAFLSDHPYGYQSLKKRDDHVDNTYRAYGQADERHLYAAAHVELAKPAPADRRPGFTDMTIGERRQNRGDMPFGADPGSYRQLPYPPQPPFPGPAEGDHAGEGSSRRDAMERAFLAPRPGPDPYNRRD